MRRPHEAWYGTRDLRCERDRERDNELEGFWEATTRQATGMDYGRGFGGSNDLPCFGATDANLRLTQPNHTHIKTTSGRAGRLLPSVRTHYRLDSLGRVTTTSRLQRLAGISGESGVNRPPLPRGRVCERERTALGVRERRLLTHVRSSRRTHVGQGVY